MADRPRGTQIALATAVLGGAVGLLLMFAWLARGSGNTVPDEPIATPVPTRPAPEPSGRTVYRFEPPERLRPTPEPDPPIPEEERTVSVPRDVMAEFSRASNTATGTLYRDCLRPWRGDGELPDTPLTINLVLLDGRVGDVEIISPTPLPDDVRSCMNDAMWSVAFPEYPPHKGELKIQRTLSLNR
jgi:hypothetical protein